MGEAGDQEPIRFGPARPHLPRADQQNDLLDLAIYAQHRVFHAVPILWRVHRVHHADTDFDVTTGVRFHPLEIALANEKRAERFFARLVQMATVASVRKAARDLLKEEREHVALVTAWMKKVPRPQKGWSHDPDPPSDTD